MGGNLVKDPVAIYLTKPARTPVTFFRFGTLNAGQGKRVREDAMAEDFAYDVSVYPAHVRPQHDEKGWRIVDGTSVVRLPCDSVDVDKGGLRDMLTIRTGRRIYLGVGTHVPLPYRLYRLDATTGSVDWQADVWAGGGLIQYAGRGFHYAAICNSRNNEVIVAGLGKEVFYLEGFDVKTGSPKFRFCSLHGLLTSE
jgi:hypothetical protein